MYNVIKLVRKRNAQAIYDEVCKFIGNEESRKNVVNAMFWAPMLFDHHARKSSAIVKAHLVVAGVDDQNIGFWYHVNKLAYYVLVKLPLEEHNNPPAYVAKVETKTPVLNIDKYIDIIPEQETVTLGALTPNTTGENWPNLKFELDCEEEGTLWEKREYTKACYNDIEDFTGFDEESLEDEARKWLNEEYEGVGDTTETTDQETTNTTLQFLHVVYTDSIGGAHDLNDGNYMSADEIQTSIEDIEQEITDNEETENEEE